MGKDIEIQLVSNICRAFSDISPDMDEDDVKQMGYILHTWRKCLSSNSSTRRIQKTLQHFLDELMSTDDKSAKQFAVYGTNILRKLKKQKLNF